MRRHDKCNVSDPSGELRPLKISVSPLHLEDVIRSGKEKTYTIMIYEVNFGLSRIEKHPVYVSGKRQRAKLGKPEIGPSIRS